jgi:ferric-dicitrate binding protein FerR (iron transport regulator)
MTADTIATTTLPAGAHRLEKRALFDLADAAGVQIACDEGLLWVTLDHDPRDIILARGESFFTTEHRRAVVYALEASRFTLRAPRGETVATQGRVKASLAWRALPGH